MKVEWQCISSQTMQIMPPCGRRGSTISIISRDVINGIAAFSGLSVDKASDGYQLQFTLYDEYDLDMDKVIGVQFAVEVGNRFALALEITPQPESAYGGSFFGMVTSLH